MNSDLKGLINLGVGFFGALAIIIGFIRPQYQILTLIIGSLTIISFVIITPIFTNLKYLKQKTSSQDIEIKKINERLKIYKDLSDLKARVNNLESKRIK